MRNPAGELADELCSPGFGKLVLDLGLRVPESGLGRSMFADLCLETCIGFIDLDCSARQDQPGRRGLAKPLPESQACKAQRDAEDAGHDARNDVQPMALHEEIC